MSGAKKSRGVAIDELREVGPLTVIVFPEESAQFMVDLMDRVADVRAGWDPRPYFHRGDWVSERLLRARLEASRAIVERGGLL